MYDWDWGIPNYFFNWQVHFFIFHQVSITTLTTARQRQTATKQIMTVMLMATYVIQMMIMIVRCTLFSLFPIMHHSRWYSYPGAVGDILVCSNVCITTAFANLCTRRRFVRSSIPRPTLYPKMSEKSMIRKVLSTRWWWTWPQDTPWTKGPLVISMKISPGRVEKYFIFSTLLAGTKIMSK